MRAVRLSGEGQVVGNEEFLIQLFDRFLAGVAECVCGMGCKRQFSFEYRNKCQIRLVGKIRFKTKNRLF